MDATPTHKTNDDDSSFTLSKEEDMTTATAGFETNSFSVSVKPTPFPHNSKTTKKTCKGANITQPNRNSVPYKTNTTAMITPKGKM
jgi:hypothetical protein